MFRSSLLVLPRRRFSSCSYSYEKPFFSPFWASLLVGSGFTFTIVEAIDGHSAMTRRQLDRMELEIRALKETKEVYCHPKK
jgi:hypothetical protein